MTVLAAALRDGKAVLVSDSRVTAGSMCGATADKTERLGAALVGFAGDVVAQASLAGVAPLPENASEKEEVEWVRSLGASVRTFMVEQGHGEVVNQAKIINAWLLVVTRRNIWTIDSAGGCVTNRNGYWAEGSGCAVAIGAMYARPDLNPLSRALLGAQAALKFDAYCGGDLKVLTL